MKEYFEKIYLQLAALFDPEYLAVKLAEWLAALIVAALILVFFYLAWLVLRLLLRPALRKTKADETTSVFTETLLKYTLLTIAVLTALDSMGIQMSAVFASLGIAGLTIGFAARDALSNLISGILIFLDRPFVIGDLVEIEGVYGRVDKITLRSTRVITNNGKMLAVPNSEVINKTVASYTNFPHLRLEIQVTVAVDTNLERARKILLELVKDRPEYLTDPAPKVVVKELNDYNIGLEFQVWLDDERKHIEKRFELREKVFNAFGQQGIDMPFETISINPVEIRKTPA